MEVVEFQRLCSKTVKNIDAKLSLKRDEQLSISQLVEEIGELAKEVNRKKLRSEEAKKTDLEDEFADVLILLLDLAQAYSIDVETAVRKKILKLQERHNL